MNKNSLCVIIGSAPTYRKEILIRIGEELGADYIVGAGPTKQMDKGLLPNKVSEIKTRKIGKTPFYYQKSAIKLSSGYKKILVGLGVFSITEWILLFMSKFRRQEIYVWTHGWYGKEGRLKSWVKRFYYNHFDGVFVYGERGKKLMIDNGISEERLHVIHNSLSYSEQYPIRQALKPKTLYQDHFSNENKNIVFIGRLTKVKRFDLLLDAIAHLKERGEFVNVTFIGDGDERANMELRVKELNIDNQVWFYGACYEEKTNAEMIYNADLCVSPGNIGLTAMHVLMFGCPAITNDDFNHQMPEFEAIRKDRSGDFFKAGNSLSLADTISRWFAEHNKDRETVRQACYKEIDERWNPNVQIEIFKKVLLYDNN